MVFLVLLSIPLLVAIGGFVLFREYVTRKEFAIQLGIQLVVAVTATLIVHYHTLSDTEVWNGVVTKKWSQHVSCSHSYSCNCRTTCDSKNNCSQTCDTCYEHFYDVDWDVATSNEDEILRIDRVDRQGLDQPPRWTAVLIGEPTSVEHDYKNYIKGAPGTLFRHQGQSEKYANLIPPYPKVVDYYRINRIISVNGAAIPRAGLWNDSLSKVNAEVGRPRQANIIIVLARDLPSDYYFALEEKWVGGKKNDIVVVMGVDANLVPQWARIMCWTTQEIFKVRLRDALMNGSAPLTPDKVMLDIEQNVNQSYVRKPMADFQYLEASIVPTPGEWAVSILLSVLISVGLTIFFIRSDQFE